ncbi:MAG: hypothetical protein LBM75_03165 [Myxococcales bacterium]|jgi:hypothetical protein|nr:hypothetical protein [Myxococcales bacterium]
MRLAINQAQELIANIEKRLIVGCTVINCTPDQDWRVLFDRPFTYVDAMEMIYGELCGTDYSHRARSEGRAHYQPLWHKELFETKTLVIDNLSEIPPHSQTDKTAGEEDFGEELPGQIDYLFMCRAPQEDKEYRSLNFGSPYFVDDDITVYIIRKTNARYLVVENILRRAEFFDIGEEQ